MMGSKKRPQLAEVEAAARILDHEGCFHHWRPDTTPPYEKLDPIGKNKFDALVERMLMVAAEANDTAR